MGGCVGTNAREGSGSSRRTSSGEGSASLRGTMLCVRWRQCWNQIMSERVNPSPGQELDQTGTQEQMPSTFGKNVPLRHEKIRWKSDMPLTEGQIRSKRDEFWDTAPAFEGRAEIWDALKAAAQAIENQDYDLAQAIIDGANIMLPNGTLTDCYDELGTRYQLPVYCLSYPLNIAQRSPDKEGETETAEGSVEGEEVVLKVRLSTNNKDVKITVRSTDTIATAKKKLAIQENLFDMRQRWFYSGKLLGDRLHVCECNIQHNFIVQAIITEEILTAVES